MRFTCVSSIGTWTFPEIDFPQIKLIESHQKKRTRTSINKTKMADDPSYVADKKLFEPSVNGFKLLAEIQTL